MKNKHNLVNKIIILLLCFLVSSSSITPAVFATDAVLLETENDTDVLNIATEPETTLEIQEETSSEAETETTTFPEETTIITEPESEESILELSRQISESISAVVMSTDAFPLNNLQIEYFDLTDKEGLKEYIKNNSLELKDYNIEYIYYMSLAGVGADTNFNSKTNEETLNQQLDLKSSFKVRLYNNIYKNDYIVLQRKDNQWKDLTVENHDTYLEYSADVFSPILFLSKAEEETTVAEETTAETETTTEEETELQTEIETTEEIIETTANAEAETTTEPESPSDIVFKEEYLTQDGVNYSISVTAPPEAEIPANSSLQVMEIIDEEAYNYYTSEAENAMGCESGSILYARIFDITILNQEHEPIQPKEGSVVYVNIQLADSASEELNVVHFGEETEVLESETEEDSVSFEATGFSVYAVIDVQQEIPTSGWTRIDNMTDFENFMSRGLYISHANGYYFTNGLTQISSTRTGITKTAQSSAAAAPTGAVLYYFEKTPDGKYKVYCHDNQGNPQYVKLSTTSLSFTTEENATPFTVEMFPNYNYTFRISAVDNGTTYYWNMQGGAGGQSFAAWTTPNDTNSRMYMHIQFPEEDDPYDLDGKTYGIAYVEKDIKSIAMTDTLATIRDGANYQRLLGEVLLTREDVVNHNGQLVVAVDDIPEWTFENVYSNRYYMKTTIDGTVKYLTINGRNIALEDTPTENSEITINAGMNNYSGKYQFSVGDYNLYLAGGSASNGFGGINSSTGYSWLNLVEKVPEMSQDDFTQYTAKKVDVSDTERLRNGDKVVIYSRRWNEDLLKYEYFVVDYNGRLVKASETGDEITWIGNKINTALWEFTEYYYEGTTTPNYYYELQNQYSEQYLAPQLSLGNQVLSDSPIGINLLGRRYGDAYSSILAWDDPYYDYAGFRVVDNQLVTCPMSKAEEFYFAIVTEQEEDEELTTVETVDNNDYGITMKMVDFNGPTENNRNALQTSLLGHDSNVMGLVNPYLEDDGYPLSDSSKTGKPENSLSYLFNNMTTVNHLFSSSTYAESGYFEFDCTQNFACLEDGTNFTVYNQLATNNYSQRESLRHGQFLPYNSLINPKTGKLWPVSSKTNTTTTLNEELPDSNPRKGEKMYEIPYRSVAYPTESTPQPYSEVDYFFGMEMSTAFTQTVSGLDAWGHDIIFEFTGDDDMWLYVDGNLILDLGGVHSAMYGNVNFRTGVVETSRETTTLRELFRRSYVAQHPDATPAEINAYLDGYFKDGGTVFKDYSKHEMKMFYMERGASASNLKMRFNLTFVKENTVILNKKISGTEKEDYQLAEFPFQIYYKTDHSENYVLMEQDEENPTVVYQSTNTPVPYEETFTPTGSTTSYNSVFLLKPGQYAEIELPANTETYYIVECGINQEIYDVVSVNGDAVNGAVSGNRHDYSSPVADIDTSPRVEFDNHVNPNALRTFTITKKLFKEDGVTPLSREEDDMEFSFRISLGGENDAAPILCNMYPYHVKNELDEYCRWDFETQGFVSLGETDFQALSEDEQISATFTTSANGAVSKIPANYSVEMRELLIGTKFFIEERDYEIPTGYKLMNPGYVRVQGSYIIEDGDTPNSGTIRDNSDPAIEVHNQRGWSLTVQKAWSDDDYMTTHNPVYFAVYNRQTGDRLSEVRELTGSESSLEFYFDNIAEGYTFDDYEIKEVMLEGSFVVDEGGVVTGYDSVTPLDEGDSITVNGIPKGEEDEEPFDYTVHYETGEPVGANDNIRVDTVSNIRAGVKITKTDLNGNPLAGAIFTLTDEQGNPIGASSYTSDASGLVTIAYLNDGVYHLIETKTPRGYMRLSDLITITKSGGEIEVSSENPDAFELIDDSEMPVIQVKNKPFDVVIRKLDSTDDAPMTGVHFSLHRQVMGNSGPTYDYFPITGYDDIVTDENGFLPLDLTVLAAGTYYLRERRTLDDYDLLVTPIEFTIYPDGTVFFANHSNVEWTDSETEELKSYDVTIYNHRSIRYFSLTVSKTVSGSFGNKYQDFDFVLAVSNTDGITYTKGDSTGAVIFVNGEYHFTLKHGETIVFENILQESDYSVVETAANQDGYITTITGEAIGSITDDTVVEFENNKDAMIPTKARTGNLLAVGILVLVGLFAILLLLIKKKLQSE